MGEIRGYGGEIRGEISQHLAAHTHTRPSWETFRSKHGGHERDAGTVAKGRRFSLPFFNLAFSLSPSFPPAPSLHLPFFRSSEEVFEKASARPLWSLFCLTKARAKRPTAVKRRLQPELFGGSKAEKHSTSGTSSSKGRLRSAFVVLGTWLCSHCLTHTYGSLMSQRS